MLMHEEILACYDASQNLIEPQPRSVALQQPFPDYYHAVANVWLVNSKAEIMVSKRSALVKANSGKWQTYFGGHVVAGDTFLDTAIKELGEEAGLIVDSKQLLLVDKGVYEPHKHFYESYMLKFNPDVYLVNFADGEVSESKWMNFKQYNFDVRQNPQKWCNGIELPIQKKILDNLKQG